jgi:hypothetical protein
MFTAMLSYMGREIEKQKTPRQFHILKRLVNLQKNTK